MSMEKKIKPLSVKQHAVLREMLPGATYRAGDLSGRADLPDRSGGAGMALLALDRAGLVDYEWALSDRGSRLYRVFKLSPKGVIFHDDPSQD